MRCSGGGRAGRSGAAEANPDYRVAADSGFFSARNPQACDSRKSVTGDEWRRCLCPHTVAMRTTLVMVLAAIGCAGTVQAAEKIRYEEMSARLAIFGYLVDDRCIDVKSLDGTKHSGTRLYLLPTGSLVLRKDGSLE